jgi:LTXXQ motif family protein
MMKRMLLVTVLTVVATSTSVWAQDPAAHEAHHPAQAATPAPPASQPATGGMGMMNMMGGGASMMNMMDMMRTMGMMGMAGAGMGGMATIDRVEGRIAFLRTELKITEAQTSAWNAFAEALRANAKKVGEVRGSMMAQMNAAQQQAPTLVDRLGLQEQWLAARLEGTRAIRSAVTALYSVLSDDQKKTANEILAPHMGMMAMMSGQMQPGQMMSGPMMRQQPAQPGR